MTKLFKNSPIVFSLFSILSCGEKSSDTESSANLEITYEIDTVMVDAGDHFFFLNWGLGLSDVTSDSKFLYNLNPESLLLEVVDLDELKLKETIQLEKEGPNGVGGGFFSKMQLLDNGNVMLFDYNKVIEVNPKGELIRTYTFDKETISGYDFGESDKVGGFGVFSKDGKTYAAPMEDEDFRKPAKGLTLIDTKTNVLKFISSDVFSKLDEFRITLEMDGNAMMSTGEQSFMQFLGEDLILTNTAFNEIYRYDLDSDSLVHLTFEAKLTGNKRIKNFPTQVDSQEALFESSKEKQKQVIFGPLIPYPEEKLIWRISQDLDRMIADSVVQKQVLTIFDSDQTMLKELKLENFVKSSRSFFKNGMLYSYLNINDEMAFVRFKPTLK